MRNEERLPESLLSTTNRGLFDRYVLREIAERGRSNIYCPLCKTHLPYLPTTVVGKFDLKGRPSSKTLYFCGVCREVFLNPYRTQGQNSLIKQIDMIN